MTKSNPHSSAQLLVFPEYCIRYMAWDAFRLIDQKICALNGDLGCATGLQILHRAGLRARLQVLLRRIENDILNENVVVHLSQNEVTYLEMEFS